MADQWTWEAGGPSGGFGGFGEPGGMMVNPTTGQKLPYDAYQSLMKSQQEQAKIAAMAAQGLNPDGSPIKPVYNSQLKADGTMKDVYKYEAQKLDPSNIDSYNAYKTQAMSTGLSPWAQMQKQLLDSQQQDATSKAAAQSMQAMGQARSGMAMRGGLSAGARERMAISGQRDLMGANQGINRTASQNLLNLGAQDAQQKQSMLGTLMNTDVQTGQFNTTNANAGTQLNLGNALKEQGNQNMYNMETYKEQMDKWAANKQADATAASGGGGGK